MNNGAPNGGQNNQRKKTLLDDWRQPHPSTLQPMPGGKYPATGVWQQKNNGAIVFKINDGVFNRDQKSNHKEVELSYSDRGCLFEAILQATTDANFGTKQIVVQKKQFIKSGGQSKISDNPIVQAMFTIIRDPNGVISFVYSKGDYKPQIVFRGPNDTVLYMKNEAGEKVEDRGTMSRWAARTWVQFHQERLNTMECAAWEPRVPKEGASNSYNNNNNNNSGGSSEPDSFGDDIDF